MVKDSNKSSRTPHCIYLIKSFTEYVLRTDIGFVPLCVNLHVGGWSGVSYLHRFQTFVNPCIYFLLGYFRLLHFKLDLLIQILLSQSSSSLFPFDRVTFMGLIWSLVSFFLLLVFCFSGMRERLRVSFLHIFWRTRLEFLPFFDI
jgi:hypothetical protein